MDLLQQSLGTPLLDENVSPFLPVSDNDGSYCMAPEPTTSQAAEAAVQSNALTLVKFLEGFTVNMTNLENQMGQVEAKLNSLGIIIQTMENNVMKYQQTLANVVLRDIHQQS